MSATEDIELSAETIEDHFLGYHNYVRSNVTFPIHENWINSKINKTNHIYYEWSKSGILTLKEIVRKGLAESFYYECYNNGQLKFIDNMKNGKKHGIYAVWDEEGNLIQKEIYNNGTLIHKEL